MSYVVTSIYISRLQILKCEYLENAERYRKLLTDDFYRGRCLPSNGTVATVAILNLDRHFHGETFSFHALAIKMHRQLMAPGTLALDSHRGAWELLLFKTACSDE